jgi:hypothetical protein
MKKSALLFNVLRAVLIVLAYRNMVVPKAAMIAPGTGRSVAHSVKTCFTISRGYLLSLAARIKQVLQRNKLSHAN